MRLGVLTNPKALHNRRFPFTHRKILDRLASEADAVVTASESEIDGAVRHLLIDRKINVLATNGGDGTIHGVVNAMVRLLGTDVSLGRASFPRLLLLNGGTYNMASRAMHTNRRPDQMVHAFLRRFREGPVNAIPTRRACLLEVHPDGQKPMLGMFFGSQTVARALDLCDRMGAGYLGLAELLARGVLGFLFDTRFYRENIWRLKPDDSNVFVDGECFTDSCAVVAATLDMKLARGMIWALTASQDDGFHVKVIRADAPSMLVRMLPHMLWEVSHPMIVSKTSAQCVEVEGDFTLDGELYAHKGRVSIKLSPYRLHLVSGREL